MATPGFPAIDSTAEHFAIPYVLLSHYGFGYSMSHFIEVHVHPHLFPFVINSIKLHAIVYAVQQALELQCELSFRIIFLVRRLPCELIKYINLFFLVCI